MTALQRFTYTQRPDLAQRLLEEESGAFPEFLLNDTVWNENWPEVLERFPDLQFAYFDAASDVVVGGANAVPLQWDGSVGDLPAGVHDAILRAIDEDLSGVAPNTICGIQAIATEEARGQGISEAFIEASRERTREGGFEHSITPLRLLIKHLYPLTPIEQYIEWKDANDAPFDPWLRVWLRAGGEVLSVCHDSLVIEAATEDWERWTSLALPAPGEYVIEGGQVPLVVEADGRSRYSEPHVWMRTSAGPS